MHLRIHHLRIRQTSGLNTMLRCHSNEKWCPHRWHLNLRLGSSRSTRSQRTLCVLTSELPSVDTTPVAVMHVGCYRLTEVCLTLCSHAASAAAAARQGFRQRRACGGHVVPPGRRTTLCLQPGTDGMCPRCCRNLLQCTFIPIVDASSNQFSMHIVRCMISLASANLECSMQCRLSSCTHLAYGGCASGAVTLSRRTRLATPPGAMCAPLMHRLSSAMQGAICNLPQHHISVNV